MTTQTGLDLGANLPGPVVSQTGHSTLSLDATTGSWYLAGGAIVGGVYEASGGAQLIVTYWGGTLDGVTLNSGLDVSASDTMVDVLDGLTLNGVTVYIGNAAGSESGTLSFDNTETLGGTGTILFGNDTSNLLQEDGDPPSTLTIARGITIHGGSGSIYAIPGDTIVNQGTIVADDSGGSFAINTTNFVNEGTVSSGNGESIGGISVINATGQLMATTEGSAAGGIAATFTDSNSSDTFNPPSINWGDGTSSDGTISGPDVNGVYTVTGTHTFAEAYVDAPLTVTVSDTGGSTAVTTGSISVADLPLHTGTATATSSTEGLTSSTLTTTFTDDNLLSLPTDFSATIDWGDGATDSSGYAISGGNGSFTLTDSHVFSEAGQRDFTITVSDQGGSSAVITGAATVNDAGLTAERSPPRPALRESRPPRLPLPSLMPTC